MVIFAMKKSLYILFILLLLAGSFVAGSWHSQRNMARKVIHSAAIPLAVSVDTKSGADTDTSSLPPGTVKISLEKQQVIGVRIGKVEKTSGRHVLRTLGRVVIDENRVYRLTTPVDGWVREIFAGTTGSIVQKDQLLAHFYSRDILTPQQAYFYALNALDRFKKEGMDSPQQVAATNAQIRTTEETLFSLGMGEAQIKEIAKTRQAVRDIEIRSPVSGLVLQRNIYPKQRFERGTEWYRIADLGRVWILADIFENEADYFRPGVNAKVSFPYQQKGFQAKVSDTPPQFDPTTRTLKVRLEVNNPGFVLRPDMFVDIEFAVQLPPTITGPADAILDAGVRKTVFVDRGKGYFEPRDVEVGRRMGDRVEIKSGLEVGERIVMSGNFLIDSESKLEIAAAGMQGALSKDPVCGMDVSRRKAEKEGRRSNYAGQKYYFDREECKREFEKGPARFLGKTGAPPPIQVMQRIPKDDHS